MRPPAGALWTLPVRAVAVTVVRMARALLPRVGAVRAPEGRSLRTYTSGTGDDLVVFESGLGLSGTCWGPVQALLEDDDAGARTLAYDRSGYGGSSPDASPRTLGRLVDDLVTMIDATPHRRLVLVGHSWGGPIVRVAAATLLARGEQVHGLVLVDPSDEQADVEVGGLARAGFAAQRAAMVPLARARVLASMIRAAVRGMPEPHRSRTVAASSNLWAARAAAAELRQFPHDLADLRTHPPDIRTTPVRIISGTRYTRADRRIRDAMNAAHRASAEALPDATFIPAPRSGHVIPASEPGIVARAVRELLAAPPAPGR